MNNNDKKRIQTDKTTKSRVVLLYILCLIVGFVFFIRLFQLQVVGGEVYRKEALVQKTKSIEIPAVRGSIYDRNHNVLAQNVKVNVLYLTPTSISDDKKQTVAEKLSPVLNMELDLIMEKMKSKDSVKLATSIDLDQIEEINTIISDMKIHGLSITTESRRFYPNGTIGAYVLGFTDMDNNGVYGIENIFDTKLKGIPGKNILVTPLNDTSSLPSENGVIYEPTAGEELTLTIDYNIQSIINKYGEAAMDEFRPKKMSIIVMNPKSGEVLGLENFPKYDPNNPRNGRNKEEVEKLETMNSDERTNYYYEMWRSSAINDTYEPGSVFKAITAAVALEEKTTLEDSVYKCDGFIKDIPGVVIRCHRWYDPHGEQSLSQALDNSCNPAFVQIIREIGKEKFYKYLSGFGFGQKTGIELPGEGDGIVPKSIDNIKEAELATISYGHGLSSTPIQMITAMNAVVNGGYIIPPKITLEGKSDEKSSKDKVEKEKATRQVISEETSKKMNDLLLSVIDNGTGSIISIPGYDVGGKSGTSIKLEDGKYKDNKTVASFFASYPAKDPKYTILVVVDEPLGENGGNTVAGPVVKNILNDIIREKGFEADYNKDEEIASQSITVPDVTGLTLQKATGVLRESGLQSLIYNSSTDINMIIRQQTPAPYSKVAKGTTIELLADPSGQSLIKMPNLQNRTLEFGKSQLDSLGLKYELKGDNQGNIIETEPIAGTMIDPGAIVKIILKDPEIKEEDRKKDQDGEQNQGSENNQNNNTTNSSTNNTQ